MAEVSSPTCLDRHYGGQCPAIRALVGMLYMYDMEGVLEHAAGAVCITVDTSKATPDALIGLSSWIREGMSACLKIPTGNVDGWVQFALQPQPQNLICGSTGRQCVEPSS